MVQGVPFHTAARMLAMCPASASGECKARCKDHSQTGAGQLMLQHFDMEGCAVIAGSCRTLSTGLKQARSMDALALNATSQSKMAGFPNTQDSNRGGTQAEGFARRGDLLADLALEFGSSASLLALMILVCYIVIWRGLLIKICFFAQEPIYQHLGEGKSWQPAAPSQDAAQDLKIPEQLLFLKCMSMQHQKQLRSSAPAAGHLCHHCRKQTLKQWCLIPALGGGRVQRKEGTGYGKLQSADQYPR